MKNASKVTFIQQCEWVHYAQKILTLNVGGKLKIKGNYNENSGNGILIYKM